MHTLGIFRESRPGNIHRHRLRAVEDIDHRVVRERGVLTFLMESKRIRMRKRTAVAVGGTLRARLRACAGTLRARLRACGKMSAVPPDVQDLTDDPCTPLKSLAGSRSGSAIQMRVYCWLSAQTDCSGLTIRASCIHRPNVVATHRHCAYVSDDFYPILLHVFFLQKVGFIFKLTFFFGVSY